MESIKELYKVGSGPSSSHTIAPQRAMKLYLQSFPDADSFHVQLYGSLSLTGRGHFTDHAVMMAVAPVPCTVEFMSEDWDYDFPNGILIRGYAHGKPLPEWVVYSLGGGSIKVIGADFDFQKNVYKHDSIEEIQAYCANNDMNFAEYVFSVEDVREHLGNTLDAMLAAVERGLSADGYLLGSLGIKRVAKSMYESIQNVSDGFSEALLRSRKLCAYAYANMEENATLGNVVTAPTCGSSGILAATMYYYRYDRRYSRDRLINALAVAGIFGNVVKTNATISGAEGGCQAEVGVACAMSAAAIAFLEGGNLDVIEYAAEIAMEHHLGLTCDPVGGYVIIPCIERNAAATIRAFDAAHLAAFISEHKKNTVSFDVVVETMKYTGAMLPVELRETSLGGLATMFSLTRKSLYYNNGSVRVTGLLDSLGRKQQLWVHYRKSGMLWEINYYQDDRKHGPQIKFKRDGEIDSVQFYYQDKKTRLDMVRKATIHAYHAHREQRRKSTNTPYFVHLAEALGIAFGIDHRNQRALAAAVLHDVIEDTGETYDGLKAEFGVVADIVAENSEDKSKSWAERKQATIDYLKGGSASKEAKIVALSDKLSNVRAMAEDLKIQGPEFWNRFNETDPSRHKWYLKGVADALREFQEWNEWKELTNHINEMF